MYILWCSSIFEQVIFYNALTFLFVQCFLMHLFVIGSRTTHYISVMAHKYAVDDIIMHSAGYRTYERVGLV